MELLLWVLAIPVAIIVWTIAGLQWLGIEKLLELYEQREKKEVAVKDVKYDYMGREI